MGDDNIIFREIKCTYKKNSPTNMIRREFKCLAILALFVPLLITNGLHDAFRLTYFVSKDTIRLLLSDPILPGLRIGYLLMYITVA